MCIERVHSGCVNIGLVIGLQIFTRDCRLHWNSVLWRSWTFFLLLDISDVNTMVSRITDSKTLSLQG